MTRRLPARSTLVLAAVAIAVSGYARVGRESTMPVKGGTLRLLGAEDVASLDTTSAYSTAGYILERSFTRQLLGYRDLRSFPQSTQPAADAATAVPTVANGGISDGGKTYTLHIRPGVMWSTTPARQVTAGDFVREFQMLCNPVAPTAAPGYFTSTIVGMQAYCAGFARVKPTAAAIKAYVVGHALAGVTAPTATTLVFHLVTPAPDFLNILALPFASARPVEYARYLPDSPELRRHTLSDGPYKITEYVPGRSFVLARNPTWSPATDPLRHAYVDAITVTEGLGQTDVQRRLEAGAGDMDWDVTPPAEELPSLQATHDPDLVVGPGGSHYAGLQLYLALNHYAGPMRNKLIRQAASAAVDKNAIVQAYGGRRIAAAASQVVLPGNVGYLEHYDPYPDNSGNGDPARSKALLARAGYPHGVAIKLLYSEAEPGLRVAQALRSSLSAGGFRVTLVPATQHDFYAKYLLRPEMAKSDVWDVAPAAWVPDWFGDNGRATIQPLFSSRGNGSSDYGGYASPELEGYLRKALTAASRAEAAIYWQKANATAMDDAAVVPVEMQKYTAYHSSRVRGCVFFLWDLNCDPTNVWLSE